MDNSNNIENLKSKYIPAETKVAEWINADAGTGASMESGSHMCAPNWADFIKAAPNKQKLITSIKYKSKKKKFIVTLVKYWICVKITKKSKV